MTPDTTNYPKICEHRKEWEIFMTVNYLWEFFIDLLEIALFGHLAQIRFEFRNSIIHKTLLWDITLIVLAFCVFFMNLAHVSSEVVFLISLLINIIASKIFFSNENIVLIVWNVLFMILAMLSEEIGILIPIHLFHLEIADLLAGGILRYASTLMYIVFLSFFVFVCCHIDNNKLFLNLTEKLSFFFLSIVYLFIAESILTVTIKLNKLHIPQTFQNQLTIFCIFFLLCYLALLIFIYRLGVSRYKNIEYSRLQQIQQLEKKEFESIHQMNKELRVMKHDLSFHINVINQLLAEKNYTDLSNYMQQFKNSLNASHQIINSGNSVVDAVLTTYIHEAGQYGIHTEYMIHLPDQLPLSDINLCSLLSNICTNAIEACKQTKEAPFFKCVIKPYQNTLFIHAENNGSGQYNIQNGILRSTKNSPDEHGIGLKRIKSIAEAAGGYVTISTKEIFQIDIMIPLDTDKILGG